MKHPTVYKSSILAMLLLSWAYQAFARPIDFYTVAEAARRRGEVAIGYRHAQREGSDGRRLGGVVVNPVKSQAVQYQPADRIIVLARD